MFDPTLLEVKQYQSKDWQIVHQEGLSSRKRQLGVAKHIVWQLYRAPFETRRR